ncbi:thiamine-binding protein [Campylobacter canadensis]|uniref:Thiamine-binding protein n=1 Tax=Campylobacter canadensis TaxID=449520 RepID=A0ABS7WTB6_9BACT|nr:thiamine-binding protein [Campylobacter canadensis]MBZ7988023.1 thiamine-binding protein [Campylobacter canadensis]MBZ7995457.1 thiamine-binding protein [Campylobacter canadensis]MBZ7996570.1 thiamine-binding protein [Campylobacter canadensis]MBZ7998986.1 thiamine-binding protein [Campylobacter canadensis]MBZ8000764.1 thiamine-binding protein [Campylobacter canadensis]
MSVTMDFCIFSMSDDSKSDEIAPIIKYLKDKNIPYKLGAMGTSVECDNLKKALKILNKANKLIDKQRVYLVAKFDIHKNREDNLTYKVKSVKEKLKKLEK